MRDNNAVEQFIEMYLKTYGSHQTITVGEIHSALNTRNLHFVDDNTGQMVRKVMKEIELKEHRVIEPIRCVGSTSEGFLICTNRDQAFTSAKYLLTKFVSIAIRYQLRKNTMNKLFPKDEFSTPLFQDASPLPDFDIEKLKIIEKQTKESNGR